MSTPDRRALLEPDHPVLSIRRQCALLALSRSGFYRAKRPASDDGDLAMMSGCETSLARAMIWRALGKTEGPNGGS